MLALITAVSVPIQVKLKIVRFICIWLVSLVYLFRNSFFYSIMKYILKVLMW